MSHNESACLAAKGATPKQLVNTVRVSEEPASFLSLMSVQKPLPTVVDALAGPGHWTHRRHRSARFPRFRDTIEPNVPAELDVHLVLDN
jgi:hypothetical protein